MKRNLPGWAKKIVLALAEVVMPRSDKLDVDLREYVTDFLDRYLGFLPFHLRVGFPLGLLLLEFGPVIYMRKLRRFSRMSLEDRKKYVAGWADSKSMARHDLLKGVKALVMVAFYSHPKVMEIIGYDIEPHIAAAMSRGY